MWRNSVSFSSKLIISNKSLYNSSTCSAANDVVRPLLHCRSEFHPYSSSPPSSSDYLKLGFQPSDGLRALSASAVDLASWASKSAHLSRHYGRCYWELSKARLSMLVVATSGTGFVLGSGSAIDFSALCWTCAGTMMVAASANSLNQVFEKHNDAKMKRTMQRPLPSGRITRPHAVTWACTAGLAGTALLASKANILAAGLAASNLILYAFVYTPLKQIHPVNTWVGAVVGAIPPLLGFRMFSLADASGQRTAAVALRNCAYLIPLGYVAYDWGVTSGWFCIESTILTLAISATAFSFYKDRTTQKARRMFHASLLYLPVFMSGILFHRISDNQQCHAEESSESIVELSMFSEDGNVIQKDKLKQHRPPVSYASVAPFPFLPVPSYAS